MRTQAIRGKPSRPRPLAVVTAPRTISEASTLGRAVVFMQVLILGLCAARVGADWSHGSLGAEGGVALILAGLFCLWLIAEAIAWVRRSRGGPARLHLVRRTHS